ncbi:Peptidylprolyl isomerase, partial [Trichostrongylus colubriformis]
RSRAEVPENQCDVIELERAFCPLRMCAATRSVFGMRVSSVFLVFAITVCTFAQEKKIDKLQIGIKKRAESCEMKSRKGDVLHMHYTGTLLDGTEFDSSRTRNQEFTFTLGMGQACLMTSLFDFPFVIKGWDQGLLNMCVGERRILTIPSHMAYGERGSPPKIPANAPLKFDVELMKIDRSGEL